MFFCKSNQKSFVSTLSKTFVAELSVVTRENHLIGGLFSSSIKIVFRSKLPGFSKFAPSHICAETAKKTHTNNYTLKLTFL